MYIVRHSLVSNYTHSYCLILGLTIFYLACFVTLASTIVAAAFKDGYAGHRYLPATYSLWRRHITQCAYRFTLSFITHHAVFSMKLFSFDALTFSRMNSIFGSQKSTSLLLPTAHSHTLDSSSNTNPGRHSRWKTVKLARDA